MALRTIKERRSIIDVETDLRGLGAYASEKPPSVETLIRSAHDVNTIERFAHKHGLTLTNNEKYIKLCISEKLPLHEQAVIQIVAAVDIFQDVKGLATLVIKNNPLEKTFLQGTGQQRKLSFDPNQQEILKIEHSVMSFLERIGIKSANNATNDSWILFHRKDIPSLIQEFKKASQPMQKQGLGEEGKYAI